MKIKHESCTECGEPDCDPLTGMCAWCAEHLAELELIASVADSLQSLSNEDRVDKLAKYLVAAGVKERIQ